MVIIILLLTAILITLLGAWPFVGSAAILASILFGVIVLLIILALVVTDISESGIGHYLRNKSRIKLLRRTIKRKNALGYTVDSYEEELTHLQKNLFKENEFLKTNDLS